MFGGDRGVILAEDEEEQRSPTGGTAEDPRQALPHRSRSGGGRGHASDELLVPEFERQQAEQDALVVVAAALVGVDHFTDHAWLEIAAAGRAGIEETLAEVVPQPAAAPLVDRRAKAELVPG